MLWEFNYQYKLPQLINSAFHCAWAVNKADLSKILILGNRQTKKMRKFGASVFLRWFGSRNIHRQWRFANSGILTENDQCPSECVGYESFIQQDTNFEYAPTSPIYFIPAEPGQICTETEAGCDEFVIWNPNSRRRRQRILHRIASMQ